MNALQIGRFFLAAVLVLLAPGGALLAWLPSDSWLLSEARNVLARRDFLSTLADAAALSIAISALFALGLFVTGTRVSGPVVVVLYGLCILLLLVGVLKRGAHLPGMRREPGWWISHALALAFVAGLVAWRFYQARALVLPAWVDSVQHTLIVRKIFEYGGLPPELSPYLSVPMYYHYGFHLIAALFVFWSGVSPEQAVLWFGQVMNAAVALSVYRVASALAGTDIGEAGDKTAGDPQTPLQGVLLFDAGRAMRIARLAVPVIAALLVGFTLQMPAYYLTWGRYTLLTGMVLLGPALSAALEVRDQPRRRRAEVLLVLFVAGLCVVHYFALLLMALFLVVVGLFSLARGLRDPECWRTVMRLAVLALLGIALASPWVWRVWQYSHSSATVTMVLPTDQSEAAQKSAADYLQYFAALMGPRRNHILMGIAGVGALGAFFYPGANRALRILASWALLLSLLSLPWGPRLGPFRPDLFAIILFFPAAVLLAELLAAVAGMLSRLGRSQPGRSAVRLALLALSGAALLAWGLRDTPNIINAATVFTTPADISALNWIKANTPANARFYINGAPWQGGVYRGVDGGYWLLPYAGRYTLVPPISYAYGSRELIQQVTNWAERSQKLRGCTPDFWSLVREADLSYMYIRQGQGALQPGMLEGCPGLNIVYEQGGVFVYEINTPR